MKSKQRFHKLKIQMGVCKNERPLAMVLCDTELCMNAKRKRVFKIPTLCFPDFQCYVFLFKERATLETKYSVSKNAGLWLSALIALPRWSSLRASAFGSHNCS